MKRFISKNSNLRIVLRHGIPPEPITGRQAVPGLYVKFENGVVNINDEDTIKLMMSHSGFNQDFILANDEEGGDPWKHYRKETEPQHDIKEIKYGQIEKTLSAKKSIFDGMPPEKKILFEKMIKETAKEIAIPLAKEMVRKVMEEKMEKKRGKEFEDVEKMENSEKTFSESDDKGQNDNGKFICQKCGYEAKNERALKTHQRFNKKCNQAD